MEYIERELLSELKKWIDRKEIIAIKGPRQSGKTTILKILKDWLIKEKGVKEEDIVFVTFEDRDMLDSFILNPKDFIRRYKGERRTYFLIDEVQYCNDIGQKLKLLYDTFEDIKFIITGSSSLELISETARFLVGRVFSFELMPLNFYEFLHAKDKKIAKMYQELNKKVRDFVFKGHDFKVPEQDIVLKELLSHFEEYVVFGGYPEVVRSKNNEEKKIVLKNIFNTYIEKDVISYLNITDTLKFKKLVSALSINTGSMISYDKLAVTCGSYFKEIVYLLDVLQQTYVIKLLRPFHKNLITELRKNPKVYFIDYGLRNHSINNFNELELRDDYGSIAENFIFNQLRNDFFSLNFWRTTAKAEVDFILSDVKEIIPIEVKFERMKKPKITRSFHSFLNSYKPKRAIVATKDLWSEVMIGETKVKFVPIVYF